ncbi:MAG: TIGR04076 family protein [Candidatus Wallbacteria bacterium HGW-Wallbacteria-1]|uniref:TIGR04076 family protein n=1 Tax=Candidatus Wallbacteria bacterium HGW-Wallbacteria-1 TaxID=2013854 RepID=A0A2N1PK61_9BACT|nr:MAG: TIGR04076 family protein [Candidatus Wallbacteria bacterium HGW-Wallbacteria-1]
MKVKLTITKANCRCGYHKEGDVHIVEDICPPLCNELWQCIYPNVYTLLNGGDLDFGSERAKKFMSKCPDGGRVHLLGELESPE